MGLGGNLWRQFKAPCTWVFNYIPFLKAQIVFFEKSFMQSSELIILNSYTFSLWQISSSHIRVTSVHNDTLYIYITRGLCLQHQFPSQYSLYDICFQSKYIYIYLPEKWTVAHYRYNVYVCLMMHFEYVPWKNLSDVTLSFKWSKIVNIAITFLECRLLE